MKVKLILLLLLLPFAAAAAQGYKIVHPDGSVEFTDQPAKNAEGVDLPDAQGYQATGPAAPVAQPASTSLPQNPQLPQGSAADYLEFAVTSPQAEQTITGTGGMVTVSVAVSPLLQPGHQVVITLDGQERARGESTSYVIAEVGRGAHQVSAAIVDATGATLREADPVTFNIFQPSRLRRK